MKLQLPTYVGLSDKRLFPRRSCRDRGNRNTIKLNEMLLSIPLLIEYVIIYDVKRVYMCVIFTSSIGVKHEAKTTL